MKIYFDGSVGKDDHGDEWITFGAIAATDKIWADFDAKWEKMLRSRYPVAPYIHMIELLDDKDPFEPQAGWTRELKIQLVQDAIVLLSQMEKVGFRMAWSSLNESERMRLANDGHDVSPDPMVHCAADCMVLTAGSYMSSTREFEREPIYVFYDRGEKFLGNFKNNWEAGRTRPGKAPDPNNGWDTFRDVKEIDLPFHFGLQVADMIAWSHTRSLSEKERSFSWLKEWLIKCVPSWGVDNTREILLKSREYRKDWEKIFRRP